jgi:Flp pilus assembly protein TadB
VISALGLGAAFGLGCFLVVRAGWRRRPDLAVALAGVERRVGSPLPSSVDERIGGRLLAALGTALGHVGPNPDLRVTGRSAERLAFERLSAGLAGLAVPAVLGLLMASQGVAVPPTAVVGVSLALAVGGFQLPVLLLRRDAARRRADFTAALSSYLDLVNVVLAGGAGTETALAAAADAGDGWTFAEIRASLGRSRALRRSPWDGFAELADELGVAELRQLAGTVRLAGQHGARVRASLEAKAATMRAHQLAKIEAAAQSATERMALPTVLLFTGFLLFVGYPAMAEIVGGSSW